MKLIKYCFTLMFIPFYIMDAQPKLSLDKPEVDLGIIYSGMKKQGKIVLKNIGTDTLHIFGVQPTCGCTAIKQPKRFLKPNESDIAEIEFNSSGYRGRVEKHISISTNDPTSQNISVKLIAEVIEELEPTGHSTLIWFGKIGIGMTSIKDISLKNVSNHPISIKNFTVSSPSVAIKMDKKTLNPKDTLNIQVSITPDKTGQGTGHFTIETDSKNQKSVEIRTSYLGINEDQK